MGCSSFNARVLYLRVNVSALGAFDNRDRTLEFSSCDPSGATSPRAETSGLLIGGGGFAIAAGGGGAVKACVTKSNSGLYIKASCRSHARRISWSNVGPRGATGAKGAPGPAGPVKLDTVVSPAIANPAGVQTGGNVSCPAGEFATGGGISGSTTTQSAHASFPMFDATTGHDDGWSAFMNNTGATAATFHVYVICTPATSVTP